MTGMDKRHLENIPYLSLNEIYNPVIRDILSIYRRLKRILKSQDTDRSSILAFGVICFYTI